MKRTFLLFALLAVTGASFARTHLPAAASKTWYLFWAHWDEWGHKSADCDGGGLCNIVACAFCEVDDAVMPYGGPVTYNNQTGGHILTIALNPNDTKQAGFIQNQTTFLIDENLYFQGGYVPSGQFQFNPGVGQAGGYLIPVVVSQN